ncbi:MAG: SLATT domain-containing protein [Desulfobacterales bacterium]|jgi:hypothetical protein
MGINEQFDFLEAEIDERIRDYAYKRKRDKIKAVLLKMLGVIFAAAITILLGLEVIKEYGVVLKNIALVLGAFITIINAFDAFFTHRSLWIQRTITVVRLYNLKRDFKFYRTGTEPNNVEQEILEEFKTRFYRILSDELKDWLKLRTEGNLEKDNHEPTGSKIVDSVSP